MNDKEVKPNYKYKLKLEQLNANATQSQEPWFYMDLSDLTIDWEILDPWTPVHGRRK